MDLTQQSPSPEEPEQQLALHSSEETPTEPAPASDSLSEETEQQASSASEDTPTQSEPPAEGTEEQPASSLESNKVEASAEDTPTQSEPPAEGTEEQPASPLESSEVEASAEDDEALEPVEIVSLPSSQSGVFITKGSLIAAASIILVVVLLIGLLVFVSRPKDPPTDWVASFTPPVGSNGPAKILYYLHWTNQNGELNGQLQLAANTNGIPQSLTVPATGMYNKENHIIYVVIMINGQADTLTGKINDTNDTLTLNIVGSTSQDSQIVFHTGSANDYKQATKKLGPTPAAK